MLPKSWEMTAGVLRIVVTRKMHLDGWYLDCEPFFRAKQLSPDIISAKQEALDLVQLQLDLCREEIIRFRSNAAMSPEIPNWVYCDFIPNPEPPRKPKRSYIWAWIGALTIAGAILYALRK